jgi:hypothetical protein
MSQNSDRASYPTCEILHRRQVRTLLAALAYTGAVAAAGMIASLAYQAGGPSIASRPAMPVAAMPSAAVSAARPTAERDSDLIAGKAMALRYFNQIASPVETPGVTSEGSPGSPEKASESVQVASFVETAFEVGRPDKIREVNIRSLNGNVLVIHDPENRVIVLAAKRVAAPTYDRAREYSRRLHYDLKRDGEKVRILLDQPAKFPSDIYVADVTGVVVAPEGVRVNVSSGGPAK